MPGYSQPRSCSAQAVCELKLVVGQVHPLQHASNSKNALCVCDLSTKVQNLFAVPRQSWQLS